MQFFQVFFNANECDRTGKPGFGIRTATVGTPESWLQVLDRDQQLRNYLSGTFEISARDILAAPDKIMAYPRTYYFKKLRSDDGQDFYALGRIVYACFDFPFYRSGTLTRPGNLINHILLFDSAPSREVFDLFFEQPQAQSFRFLPVDYTPRTDNAEMTALMLGKSEPLPIEPLHVAAADVHIVPESYNLYSQLIDLLAKPVTETPKPIVIKVPAAQAGVILAGLMRLLPDEQLPQMTFFANHQENGALKGVKLTVINEYFPGLYGHLPFYRPYPAGKGHSTGGGLYGAAASCSGRPGHHVAEPAQGLDSFLFCRTVFKPARGTKYGDVQVHQAAGIVPAG